MKFSKSIFFLFVITLLASSASAQVHKDWSTYYGDWTIGRGTLIISSAYDPISNCIYIAGTTTDTVGIATPGSFKSSFSPHLTSWGSESDLFLVKFDTFGHRIWGTYYGGTGNEEIANIAIDGFGNIFLAGYTRSATGIATPGSHLSTLITTDLEGPGIPFLVKFDTNGNRLWGTYYGGVDPITGVLNGASGMIGITIDRNNNVYIAGVTAYSSGIATPGSFKDSFIRDLFIDPVDGFIAKFDNNGVRQWGTYYGGSGSDNITSMYADDQNNIYALGFTKCDTGIATIGAAQTQLGSPQGSAFLTKFTSSGQRVWGTYIGGTSFTYPYSVKGNDIGGSSNMYVTGYTQSPNAIATPGNHQTTYGGGVADAFIMSYTPAGNKVWGAYIGGEGDEITGVFLPTNDIAFDGKSSLIFTGGTTSLTQMIKGCGYTPATHKNGFIARFKLDGTLSWSSYFDDHILSITHTPISNSFYLTGFTTFDGLATVGAFKETKTANKQSGFFTKLVQDCPSMNFSIQRTGNLLSVDSILGAYQWYKDGNAIAGAQSDSFTFTGLGSYFVEIDDSCGCSYLSDTLVIDNTGIRQLSSASLNASIVPNPNNGQFNIQLVGVKPNAVFEYRILDITGRVLESDRFTTSSKNIEYPIQLSAYQNGIYLLQITGDNKTVILKCVKQ